MRGTSHACGELALGEVAHVTQIANGSGDLQAALTAPGVGNKRQWGGGRLGLFDLEAFVAAAAEGVRCAELHQAAMVAAQDLPLFDGCHHGCHKLSCSGRTQSKDRSTRPITEHVMCLE